jgi:RNA polymerase sigma factor (sigma-70 family)
MIVRYYQELLNHFTRMVQDRDSAADIVQEAYARVLAQCQDIAQPRALLYHTARNLVIDRHRRSVARGELEPVADGGEAMANVPAPAAWEPETALASAQAVDAMLQAIEDLPPRCREAFILHRFDGLPHAEVAGRMGISRKTVEQHIALAMAACRRCKAELDAPARHGVDRGANVSRGRRAIVAGAGLALVLPGGLAGWVWWQPLAGSTHATAEGDHGDTMLADGSRLQLAPASRAAFALYRTRREAELAHGQARFEVSRDPARPFTVLAGALRITVVGTRFSVHRTAGPHGGVRVAVEEGHVRVARSGWFAGPAVDLVAGQAVGSDAGGALGAVSALRAAKNRKQPQDERIEFLDHS